MGIICNVLFSLAVLAHGASAQAADPTSSYYAPGIPTDSPVAGNYEDYLRPKVHFTPPRYFMNDPNGLHRDPSGLWHIYYQYNPLTPVAGNQHWGHATSRDLFTWEDQKIAVWPPNNYTYVFSGSAVIDANNTSGFFPNQTNGVVAIYTLAEYPNGEAGLQYQAISYSRDGGYSFEAYSGNPILNLNSTQFRDPYVIWHENTQRWVMVISFASDWVIGIFTSSDLKAWTHASNITKIGYLGGVYGQYECPNLVQMPMKGQEDPVWFLMISINPGGPRGGSVSQYFVGDFNGTHFQSFDEATRFTDFAKDNYAAQFFNGVSGNESQIALGWASNWEYTQLVPTGLIEHGQFRSSMTVPRAHYIANVSARGYDLISEIVDVGSVVDSELAYNASLKNGTTLTYLGDVASGSFYMEANITNLTKSTLQGSINFTISSSISGEYIQGGINAAGGPGIWIDRGHVRGFDNPYFSDKFSEEGIFGASNNGTWGFSMIYDKSILEIFLNGGQAVGTLSFFPTRSLDTLTVYAGGIAETAGSSVGVWALLDPRAKQANGTGSVARNGTMQNMRSLPFE